MNPAKPQAFTLSDPELLRTHCLIDGQWCAAEKGGSCEVHNPATGELLGTVPDMGAEETRRAILLAKAEEQGWRVPAEAIEFIAHNSRQNIRELEGALNKVVAYAGLIGQPIDLELVNMALADSLRRPERISVEQIIDVVCRYYDVYAVDLAGSSRKSAIVYPRQVAMYLSRTETDASLPQIGAMIGSRDHTTVLHGYEKISGLADTDPQLRRDLLEIKTMLYDGSAVITH